MFSAQESKLYLLHWQADSLPLSHQGNPPSNLWATEQHNTNTSIRPLISSTQKWPLFYSIPLCKLWKPYSTNTAFPSSYCLFLNTFPAEVYFFSKLCSWKTLRGLQQLLWEAASNLSWAFITCFVFSALVFAPETHFLCHRFTKLHFSLLPKCTP